MREELGYGAAVQAYRAGSVSAPAAGSQHIRSFPPALVSLHLESK